MKRITTWIEALVLTGVLMYTGFLIGRINKVPVQHISTKAPLIVKEEICMANLNRGQKSAVMAYHNCIIGVDGA